MILSWHPFADKWRGTEQQLKHALSELPSSKEELCGRGCDGIPFSRESFSCFLCETISLFFFIFFSPKYFIHYAILVHNSELYVDRGEEMVYDCVMKPVRLMHKCERIKSRFMDNVSSGFY